MDQHSFEAFMRKVQEDDALAQELRAKLGDPAEGIAAADLERFAAEKGYRFDLDEISGELSDEDLEAVAGGAGTFSSTIGTLSLKFYSPSSLSFPKVESFTIKW
ncbi:MAG: Nif11-like leader peptide family RiPP precursor [Gammaproteobacteria bacterium]